jgi:hypothetical protein
MSVTVVNNSQTPALGSHWELVVEYRGDGEDDTPEQISRGGTGWSSTHLTGIRTRASDVCAISRR